MTSPKASPAATGVRVLVYGSCVSRDSIEAASAPRLSVLRYVARQSLISAFAGRAPLPDVQGVESAFQRRMLQGDAEGDLARTLEADAAQIDLLLWDLTDERLGVLCSPQGHIVTRSVDLISSGLIEGLSEWRLVEFGTDEHFTLWDDALKQFLEVLERLRLRRRTLLLAVPWAEQTDDGSPVRSSFGMTPRAANALFERYHRRARERGVAVAAVPPDTVVAASGHRWGPAPFHYTQPTYETVLSVVGTATATTTPDEGAPPC